MKAFIGRDFDENYDQFIQKIVTHIEAHDIECITAKRAQSKPVDEKVTDLILSCEIFVGIFTCDRPILVKDTHLNRVPKKNRIFTTSNWVIQESGFAIGSDRGLILLIEDGVHDFPKLQGNIEYIPFKRDSIEESFTKLSEIINDVKTKITGGTATELTEENKQVDTTKPEHPEGPPKEETKNEKDKALNKVFEALFKDKDYSKAQRIFDEEAEALLDDDDRAPWRAYILRESHSPSTFGELEKLVQENEDDPRVIKHLAYRYKEMGEFAKAKEKFLLAAEKYDVNDAEKKSGLVDAYIQAAWCLAEDDDLNGALSLLRKLLFDANLQDSKAQIFKAMAKISKNKNNIERFFIYAEAALDINPCDTDLRFRLALTYSENKDEKLSLLHNKKHTDTTEEYGAFNNLGVQYSCLEMPGKGIKAYKNAIDKGQTIAMANIAQKYLNEGFVDDAQKILDKANKLKIEPTVGQAQERIKNITKKENEKEKEILLEAEKQRKFRVSYSKAFCLDKTVSKNQIEGIWETPWGNGKLNFDENTKAFNIKIQKEIDQSLLSSLLTAKVGIPRPEPKKKFQNISIEGTFEGLGGKYNIRISEGKEAPTLLTGEAGATGHLILNDDLNNMSVMEKTKDGKIEFKQWKKQLDAPSPS